MALSSIEVHLNKTEYSRYESGRSIVKARVIPTPSASLTSESVVIAIEKKGIPIATKTIVFTGNYPKGSVIEFDLNQINDADGTSHINRGEYTVTATQNTVIGSDSFKVAIITSDEMRRTYCQGLHLVSGLKVAPKKQPIIVTGVKITSVAKDTKRGIVSLVFDKTAMTLQWGGGVPILITEENETEILPDSKGRYIEVEIDYYSLPDSSVAEGILLDAEELTNEFIQAEIEKATQESEAMLKIMLEPTRMATEPYYSNPKQGEYFDALASPQSFYEKDFNMRGMGWHISLPYHQVSKVTELAGYIGNTKALEISSGAVSVNRKTGVADILPYNSQYAMYWTFFLGINFWGVREFIADFWRYKAVIGINEKIPAEVIKVVGYIAAISILTTAEQAYRAGITSESISKDGVSRSISYNARGIYDTTIQEYKEWIKLNVPKFRNLYRGIPCVVI